MNGNNQIYFENAEGWQTVNPQAEMGFIDPPLMFQGVRRVTLDLGVETGSPEVAGNLWRRLDPDGLVETVTITAVSGTDPTGETVLLTESAPVAWQEIGGRRVPVDVAFVVSSDSSVSFRLGAYDRRYPLTIDPTYEWHTFYGSGGADWWG